MVKQELKCLYTTSGARSLWAPITARCSLPPDHYHLWPKHMAHRHCDFFAYNATVLNIITFAVVVILKSFYCIWMHWKSEHMKLIRVSATNKIAQDTTIVCPTQAYFWHNDVVGLAHVTFQTCRYPNSGHMQAIIRPYRSSPYDRSKSKCQFL